jgi:hypothetical protein
MLVGNRIKLPARGDYCTILGLTESFIYAHVVEWSKATVCKTVQSWVRIPPCAQTMQSSHMPKALWAVGHQRHRHGQTKCVGCVNRTTRSDTPNGLVVL